MGSTSAVATFGAVGGSGAWAMSGEVPFATSGGAVTACDGTTGLASAGSGALSRSGFTATAVSTGGATSETSVSDCGAPAGAKFGTLPMTKSKSMCSASDNASAAGTRVWRDEFTSMSLFKTCARNWQHRRHGWSLTRAMLDRPHGGNTYMSWPSKLRRPVGPRLTC